MRAVANKKETEEVVAQIKKHRAKNKKLIDDYSRLFYLSPHTWQMNKWMGYPILKFPNDLWIMQEALFESRPQLIIETGTAYGGSALFYAHMLDIIWGNDLENGIVISIDIENSTLNDDGEDWLPTHPRTTFITANSLDRNMLKQIKNVASGYERVMVILDSCHTKQHVYTELMLYSEFVTVDGLLLVEDTSISTWVKEGVFQRKDSGPSAAVSLFLKNNDKFKAEAACERLLTTANVGGWLRRISA